MSPSSPPPASAVDTLSGQVDLFAEMGRQRPGRRCHQTTRTPGTEASRGGLTLIPAVLRQAATRASPSKADRRWPLTRPRLAQQLAAADLLAEPTAATQRSQAL
jgi:hypothetical protein